MSLILDALKRAERERRADPMPGVELPAISPQRRRRLWQRIALGLLLAVVALIVLAVTVRLVRGKRASQPVAMRTLPPKPSPQLPQQAPPQTGSLLARPAPESPPAAAPAAPAPAPRPTVIPGTESVSSLDELSEPEPPPPAVVLPGSQPKPQAYTNPSAAAPPPEPSAAPADTPAEPAAQPAAQPEAAPQPGERGVPQSLTQQAPLRKLREMPPEFRADFPPLNVQVHNYEREAAKRFVIVNDRRYHEGENLAEGPHLTEIVKDGMVLEFRGEKLLYSLNR